MVKKIKPIRYFYVHTNPDTNIDNKEYVFPEHKPDPEKIIASVNIEPKKFADHTSNPLELTNKNWFINLTNTPIPPSVSALLQLGGNFCLPLENYKKKAIHEFIKDLECHNRHFSDVDKAKIRNTFVPFFSRFIHKKNQ